jgi:hypothetical protein
MNTSTPGRCARPGCPNPLPRNRTGRPRIYCSPQCRAATYRRPPPGSNAPLQVDIDHDSTTDRGRPSGHVWQVLLRRGNRHTIIATGLGRPSAEHLAQQIREVINPTGIDTQQQTR